MRTAEQLIDEVFIAGGQLWLEGDQVLRLEKRGRVFRAIIDGQPLTYISPNVITLEAAKLSMQQRFGEERVHSVLVRS